MHFVVTTTELILAAVVSFLAGAALIAFIAMKLLRYILGGLTVQNITVIRVRSSRIAFVQLCVDLPMAILRAHVHPLLSVDPELADELAARLHPRNVVDGLTENGELRRSE